jgi:hypothetical protein
MSAVQIQGNASGTGTLTIAAPNTNTNQTLTLPDLTGTLAVNGPAFSAYATSNQSITVSVNTKITFDTEDFDTNSNFLSSRFTPTVAGYYQINLTVRAASTGGTSMNAFIYRTGALYQYNSSQCDSGGYGSTTVSQVVYLNGSTDYVEGWGQINGASGANFNSGSLNPYVCRMSGSLVRAA